MAHELKKFNMVVVSLYPGLARINSMIKNAKYFDMHTSESQQFIGRFFNTLANDPNIMKKSGKVLVAAQEAVEYEIKDVEGKHPRPQTRIGF